MNYVNELKKAIDYKVSAIFRNFNIEDKLEILYYDTLDLEKLLEDLYSKYNAERLTIQSGGTLNGMFVRNKLIDFVNIVIAPIIVEGKDVATLVDGESIRDEGELNKLLPLQLLECNKLEDSYIQLKYSVIIVLDVLIVIINASAQLFNFLAVLSTSVMN